MAELGMTFDAKEIDPSDPFVPIPAGMYEAMLVESKIRETKDGLSKYLELKFEITEEGDYSGRKVWDRLCLFHDDEKTKQIAMRRLSALCHATGKLSISESEELHEIPVVLTVRVRPQEGQYPSTNEVRSYAPVNGGNGLSKVTSKGNGLSKANSAAVKPADLDDDIPFWA